MKAKEIYFLGLLAALPFGLEAQEYWDGTKTLDSEINRNGAVKMGYARIRSNTQISATVIEHLPLNGNIFIRSAVSSDDVGDILMNDLGGNVGIGISTPSHKLTVSGEMASANPNNRNAAVQVGWNNNVARIRIGGSGIGAGTGLDIQRNSDESLMRILGNGNVGIGVSSPISKLQIGDGSVFTIGNHSNANVSSSIHFAGFRDVQSNYFGASIEASPNWVCCNGFPGAGYGGVKYINLDFYVHGDYEQASSKKLAMSVRSSGDVTIGTTDSRGYKLAVNGNIRAKEVKVEAANWPDYVFGEDYKLPDLNELFQYIKIHRHLPGMPSAKEAEADGIDLGEMNRKLLEKVEELTLYLLEEKKQREHLERTVKELISRMDNKG